MPALPGSRTWAQITTSETSLRRCFFFGCRPDLRRFASAVSSGTSIAFATATTPCGVTVSVMVARFCSLTA